MISLACTQTNTDYIYIYIYIYIEREREREGRRARKKMRENDVLFLVYTKYAQSSRLPIYELVKNNC